MSGVLPPGADGLSAAYWQGAARGVLVLQKCGRCGRVRHYPQVLCPFCRSADVRPVEADPGGTVLSWTVTEHAFDPSVADQVPYVLVIVDMDEGVRILGRFRGSAGPQPGLPVRLAFEPGPDGHPTPVFSPVPG
jgi:uncharacterized OB-fold protein